MDTSRMEHAARLVEQGFYLFRLGHRTKEPKPGISWAHESTRDLQTIEKWLYYDPTVNFGIDCAKSGIVVIDCDVKRGLVDGRLAYRTLMREHGLQALGTWMVITPSGGMHHYFRAPDVPKLGNTAGRLAEGIDTRGAGGYVVAPGSVTEAGVYRLTAAITIAPLPVELVRLLRPPEVEHQARPYGMKADLPRYGAAAIRGELERLAAAKEGTRNHSLFCSAARLGELVGGGVLDREDMAALLLVAGTRIGLTERECRSTIESGLRRGERQPRHLVAMDGPA